MKKPVGILVVGCGYWGVNYLRVFSELADSRVIAACDRRTDRLAEVARRFPGVQLTTSLEDAVVMEGVDAVVVATTASTHHRIASLCLEAGKHTLVEKPLTTVSEDAAALGALAESRSLLLMVGHTFVYNNGIRRVKEYVENEMGKVYYLYARRTNLGPFRHDVNALWDLAPHDIAIFNYLLGSPPRWVSAVGAKVLRNCREDVGFISLGYQDNVVGHIHVSWADPHKTREVVVVGSNRRVVFNDMNGVEQVRVFEKGVRPVTTEPLSYGEYQFDIRDGDILSPRIEVGEPLKNQCRHFLDCVVQNRRPLTGAREGQHVVEALEAVDRSIALNGAPVEVIANAPLLGPAADRRPEAVIAARTAAIVSQARDRTVQAFGDALERVFGNAHQTLAAPQGRSSDRQYEVDAYQNRPRAPSVEDAPLSVPTEALL